MCASQILDDEHVNDSLKGLMSSLICDHTDIDVLFDGKTNVESGFEKEKFKCVSVGDRSLFYLALGIIDTRPHCSRPLPR